MQKRNTQVKMDIGDFWSIIDASVARNKQRTNEQIYEIEIQLSKY